MTTYIRPSAVARDDADMIAGWNITPNTGYQLQILATASGVVVILLDVDGSTLIGSGVAAVGTAQPVTITPMSGQTVDMADATLGWHMLLTTDGTEGDRTITLDAMVDLSARTHPVYVDDDLALAVAAADINAGTHYTQDVVASCPLGFGAGVGDTASVPVDGAAVVGQVESVTWSGTPDGSTAQAVIRAHIPIRPDAYTPPVVPTPPTVVDDAGTTDAATTTSGNVLANDSGGTLIVSAVNGISSNVGVAVAGNNGGEFIVNADGAWTFDPSGDFAELSGSDTATTSVTYHASNGDAEASATLTVTVTVSAEIVGISFVGATSMYAANTVMTLSLPSGILPGDLVLIAWAQGRGGYGDPVMAPTTSGYTVIADMYAADDRNVALCVAYKRMGATPDTTVVVPGTPHSSLGGAIVAYVLRGVSSAMPLDVSPTQAQGLNTSAANPSAITTVSDLACVLIISGWASSFALTATAPAGYTNLRQTTYDPGTTAGVAVAMKEIAVAGPTDPSAFTMSAVSAQEAWCAVTVALRPGT